MLICAGQLLAAQPPTVKITVLSLGNYDWEPRGLMSNVENQDRERNVRDRIATIVQAHDQATRKKATDEEIQILRRAVGPLDQLLADIAADEEARRKLAKGEGAQAARSAG